MTLDEAINRKIYQIRLPCLDHGFFIDPRITEHSKDAIWARLFKYGKQEIGVGGKPVVGKIMILEEENRWEAYK